MADRRDTSDRPASFDPGPELRAAAADLNRRSGATGPVTDPQVLAKVAAVLRAPPA